MPGVHIDPDTGERAPGGIPAPIPGQVLEPGMAAPEGEDAHGGEAEAEEPAEAAEAPVEAADLAPEADADGVDEDSVQAEVVEEAADEPQLEAADLPEEAEEAREPGPDTETPTESSDPVE